MNHFSHKIIGRILAFAVALIMLAGVCSCTPSESPEPTEISAATDEPAKETRTPDPVPTEVPSEGPGEETPVEETPYVTPAETASSPAADTPTPQPTEVPPPTPTPDPAAVELAENYKGVVISKVYGNGGNDDGICEHSFIELCNTSSLSISLDGLSLYYKKADTKDGYRALDLGGVILPPGGFYLIRCAGAKDYKSRNSFLAISDFDLSWDVTIDNKEVALILAPSENPPSKDVRPDEFQYKVSYFIGSDTYLFDTGFVGDMAKSKIAVRVALKPDSGYRLLNVLKQNSYTLSQIAPLSSKGSNKFTGSALNEVLFDHDPGFYDSSFSLVLTAKTGWKIYYTTDGTDPRTSKTRKLYNAPIAMEDTTRKGYGETTRYIASKTGDTGYVPKVSDIVGGTVVKACATDGKETTDVYTSSYFVSSVMKTYSTTVMSVSLPKGVLCDDPGTAAGGAEGGFYTHYYPSTNDPNPRGMAFMEVFDPAGIRRGYSNVELSVSGHGSSGWHMKSLKIYYKGTNNETGGTDGKLYYDLFDGYAKNIKGQTITDFSRLLIRNSGNDCALTYIRDVLMQRLSRELRLETQSYAPALVFINGEFWGVYNVRERYSGDYVESHYGVEKDNVALIESDYSQVHTNQNADFVVTSGLDDDADPFNQLVDWIDSHDLSKPSNYKYVCERLDIDSFIDMYVARIYFSARDWPENNIKVWRNRAGDKDRTGNAYTKWHFSLLDMDFGLDFPNIDTGPSSNWFGWINSIHCTIGRIMNKLIQNPEFKKQFLSRFYQVVNEIYVPSVMEAELDNIVSGRESIFQLQVDRWSKDGASWSSYRNGVSLIRNFLQRRNSYVISYLCGYFNVTESYLMSITGNYVSADFLESRAVVKINGKEISAGWNTKFEDSFTFTVAAEAMEGYNVTAITFTDCNGVSTRIEGNSAEFTASVSGTVSVEARKISSGTISLKVRPGITAAGCTLFYLDEEGNLYGWGSNVNNILGSGEANVTSPKFIMDNVAMVSVCSSNDYENNNSGMICAAVLTLDGEIYSVGGSAQGAGRSGNLSSWGIVGYEGEPVEISVGYDHLLVLDKSGDLYGIGNNSYGQLGAENYQASTDKFQKIASGVTVCSAGRRNTAFIDEEGDCFVLGDGRWNKFNDSTDNFTEPYKLMSGVVYIESGEHNLVLVDENGNAYYAGWREVGSFIQGGGSHGAAPVLKGKNLIQASIMFSNMLMVSETGAAYVYGQDLGGAIGGAVTGGNGALLISSGVKQAAAGYNFSAFLMEDGTVKILGDNSCGQHANGGTGEVRGYSIVSIKQQ